MRYIGSKSATIPWLSSLVARRAPDAASLCDPFAGTCTVARHFKRSGLRVVTGDALRLSYVFQVALVGLDEPPSFRALRRAGMSGGRLPGGAAGTVFDHLNGLSGVRGFVYNRFSPAGRDRRMFFTPQNAARIDAIREKIAFWRGASLINEVEEAFLLAALIDSADKVANTAGTYYAYLKAFTRKARIPFRLSMPATVKGRAKGVCHQTDARALVAATDTDILYLDPPYNERSYPAYYHLPETFARGDCPPSQGLSGAPPANYVKSDFCRPAHARNALTDLIVKARAKHIVVHYASDGIVPHHEIVAMLTKRGRVRIDDLHVRAYTSTTPGGLVRKTLHRVYWCDVKR